MVTLGRIPTACRAFLIRSSAREVLSVASGTVKWFSVRSDIARIRSGDLFVYHASLVGFLPGRVGGRNGRR
jgi:hypothetical protein